MQSQQNYNDLGFENKSLAYAKFTIGEEISFRKDICRLAYTSIMIWIIDN